MKTVRRIAVGFGITIVTVLLAAVVWKAWWDSGYYDGYDPNLPLNTTVRGEEERPAYRRVDLTYEGLPGQPVPTLLALPPGPGGPWPCIVFLHGIGQKKDFLDEIAAPFTQAGFAIVTFDQHTRGERKLKETGRLDALRALRRRGALTVIETRRLVDYLQTRPDIDAARLYLCGASYGAITGSTAAAFDKRFRAVVLVYGGGNLRVLLSSAAAAREAGKWLPVVSRIGAFFQSPGDPVKYVKGISPRPVLFQNGTHDSLIPTAAAQALYDAAAQPKEIIWYDSDHVGLDPEQTWQVLNDAIAWLKKQDAAVKPAVASEEVKAAAS